MTTLRRGLAGAALAALALMTTACTGGSEGGDALAASETADTADTDGGGSVAREAAPGAVGPDAAAANRTLVQLRSVIRTGEVAVSAQDLDAARAELDEILLGLDGAIDSESTSHDRDGRIESSTLVVRVPVDRFEAAMDAFEGLGTAEHSDSHAKDVTTEVIDVEERVETLENSLDRLQSFQDDAQDIEDLLRYEQQITDREAELQSLRSQQSYLRDQTSMSTITVYLSVPEKFAPPPGALDDAGFLAGLQSGWNALKGTLVVILTVAGAVTPFAAAAALVAVPLALLLRRTLRARAAAAPATSDVPGE